MKYIMILKENVYTTYFIVDVHSFNDITDYNFLNILSSLYYLPSPMSYHSISGSTTTDISKMVVKQDYQASCSMSRNLTMEQ
jgi:hypothetical protein